MRLKTIDAHAGGGPLRLVTEGFPVPRGQTMIDKRDWAASHADHLRRSLMLEPRGHTDMCGAVLTEPVSPGSHAGVLFMHNDGFGALSGHGIIAVTTIALERGLVMPGGDRTAVVFDTVAGAVRARAFVATGAERADSGSDASAMRVEGVSFVGVPSFVLHGGLPVKLGTRQIRADVAFGGAFYAIVDGEAVGVPIDAAHAPELRRAGAEICRAIEAFQTIVHPLEPRLHGMHGTVFTGPPHDAGADLRTVTVFADRALDRSASGTGAAAIVSVLDAIGLLGEDKPFVCEGLIGTRLTVRVAGRTMVGEYAGLIPEVAGSAWITGDHTFIVDEDDRLREGFRV